MKKLFLYFICLLCFGVTLTGCKKGNSSPNEKDTTQVNNKKNETDKVNNSTLDEFTLPEISWRIAPTKYETKDTIVMGYDIRDFGIVPNAEEDATGKIQAAMMLLNRSGGGTLFLPEGTYVIKGNLNIPKGVTICGDWINPDESEGIKGTILKAYAGRGNAGGTPFITLQPNASLRDLSIWYPEQDANHIAEYPTTVCLFDPSVWGADYTHVKNVTFVNSYKAVQQGPNGSGCPNVRNVYGTPLSVGLSMDGIVDIGRMDYIKFSPVYWENSRLPGAPDRNSKLREYLYENAVGITAGRVDWSYFTYTEITGYFVGFQLREGELNEAGNFPNGQVFRHTYKDCNVGLLIDGVADVGEAFAEIKIENCEIGIKTTKNTSAKDGIIQIFASEIHATKYAIYQEGYLEISLILSTIEKGQIYSNEGSLMFTKAKVNSEPAQIVLEGDAVGIVLNGTKFAHELQVKNAAQGMVSITKEVKELKTYNPPPDCMEPVNKIARNELYTASLDVNDKSDITKELQMLLDQAKSEGGGIVFLPPGEYCLKKSIIVPEGVELRGAIDVGRNPIRIGTILRIRSVAGENKSAVTLEANSGIRGIVFDYPEQDFTAPREYPYAITGAGENIFIVNVSLRGAYNGVDMMTNRCDNHYIEYLSGICMNNVVSVGAGAIGGRIFNTQVNYICLSAGDESKFGTWDNAPTGDTKEAESKKILKYLQENLVVFKIGDVKEELLFDNFSYNGNVGMKFVEENGRGASGYCVGQGVDYSSRAFEIHKLSDMQFVNTQLVSYKEDFNRDNETVHIVLRDTQDLDVVFYNVSAWARPVNNIKVENGKLHVYNARFCSVPEVSVVVSENGFADLANFSYRNDKDLVLAAGTLKNIRITGLLFLKNLVTRDGYGHLDGLFMKNNRLQIPTETRENIPGREYLFAESFSKYPTSQWNGIEVLQPTENFSEMGQPYDAAYVGLIHEDNNSYAVMHLDQTATQTYLKSERISLSSAAHSGKYTMEMKLKMNEMSSIGDGKFFNSMDGIRDGQNLGSELLYEFTKDNQLLVQGNKVADYKIGEWYFLTIEFDLNKETNRNYILWLHNANKELVGSSHKIMLREDFQKGNISLSSYQLGLIGGMSKDSGSLDVFVDYIVGYK